MLGSESSSRDNMPPIQRIAVLGATGSIGQQTLQVIALNPERYQVVALSIHSAVERFIPLVKQFKPMVIGIACPKSAKLFLELYPNCSSTLLIGKDAARDIASLSEVDTVVAGIVGAAGLSSVMAAARHAKRILFANKEVIVVLGKLLFDAMAEGALLLPVDSEHNGVFQCMPSDFVIGQRLPPDVEKIMITCSGGPFLNATPEVLASVTPEMAIRHPVWSMGPKISIDSATLMNKALEIIEAHWLFGGPATAIDVLIHPQSIVHAMVRYRDGSILSHMGTPDMRTPIAHCLSYPSKRIKTGVEPLDFTNLQLSFAKPCPIRHRALGLAYEVLAQGGLSACIFNAANEIAVEAFVAENLPFNAIVSTCERALAHFGLRTGVEVDEVLDLDTEVRQWTRSIIKAVVTA